MHTDYNAQTYNVYLTVKTFILYKIIVCYCGGFVDGQSRGNSFEKHWRISFESVVGVTIIFILIKYVRSNIFLEGSGLGILLGKPSLDICQCRLMVRVLR